MTRLPAPTLKGCPICVQRPQGYTLPTQQWQNFFTADNLAKYSVHGCYSGTPATYNILKMKWE